MRIIMAKIIYTWTDTIRFDNGVEIECCHQQDCCEDVWADCRSIDDLVENLEFDTNNLVFEALDTGFRFGNNASNMIFVPCYNEQNGYYSGDITVYLKRSVLEFETLITEIR